MATLDRMPPIAAEHMTPDQNKAAEAFAAGRGYGVRGPFAVMLRSPEVMLRAKAMGDYLRFRNVLPKRVSEMVILITAREWTQQYEWAYHYGFALEAGLSQAIIAAIAEGRRPESMTPDEEAIYNFCTELLKTSEVSDATFRAAKDKLGEAGVVELLGIVGYYGTVSMLVNTDRYPLPEGVMPELKPLP